MHKKVPHQLDNLLQVISSMLSIVAHKEHGEEPLMAITRHAPLGKVIKIRRYLALHAHCSAWFRIAFFQVRRVKENHVWQGVKSWKH